MLAGRLEYLFIHCCILYTLLYILQEGKPAKGFSTFRLVLGRLLNSYAFMQRMPAKIYRHVCIHSTDTGIIARFSAVSNTKLQFSQHSVTEKPPCLPLRGCARRRVSERNRRRRLLARRLKVARRPDEGRVQSAIPQRRSRARPPLISPLRGQLLPREKPFGRTLSPSPAPPGRCSSVSSPRPRRGWPRPDQTTSHSRSPTAAR